MDKYLCVNCRLKYRALRLKIAANQRGIRKIAVMSQRESAARIVNTQRLGIRREAEPRCCIAHMTDSNFCVVKTRKLLAKNFADQPHAFFHINPIAIGERNACTLLSAVLERKEAEVRHLRDIFRWGIYPIDAALFLPLWHFFVHRAYASPVSLWSISL